MPNNLGGPDGITPATHQQPPELFKTTFHFPWTKAPLSMNDRLHHMAKAKITARLRSLAHAKARHVPDLGRCRVTLVWVVNTRSRRDEENIVATLKPLCDGLVDAEIVPDDTPEYMVKPMPQIVYIKGAVPHFELTIEEIA